MRLMSCSQVAWDNPPTTTFLSSNHVPPSRETRGCRWEEEKLKIASLHSFFSSQHVEGGEKGGFFFGAAVCRWMEDVFLQKRSVAEYKPVFTHIWPFPASSHPVTVPCNFTVNFPELEDVRWAIMKAFNLNRCLNGSKTRSYGSDGFDPSCCADQHWWEFSHENRCRVVQTPYVKLWSHSTVINAGSQTSN